MPPSPAKPKRSPRSIARSPQDPARDIPSTHRSARGQEDRPPDPRRRRGPVANPDRRAPHTDRTRRSAPTAHGDTA